APLGSRLERAAVGAVADDVELDRGRRGPQCVDDRSEVVRPVEDAGVEEDRRVRSDPERAPRGRRVAGPEEVPVDTDADDPDPFRRDPEPPLEDPGERLRLRDDPWRGSQVAPGDPAAGAVPGRRSRAAPHPPPRDRDVVHDRYGRGPETSTVVRKVAGEKPILFEHEIEGPEPFPCEPAERVEIGDELAVR